MKSYTNKSGEIIEVSEEHLDMAIRIKIELQKASPSRRCSWVTHKRLMEKEGFYNSENNESYRCLIKNAQKALGELPDAPRHANMVAEGKIESIKELVGEISYATRENQHVLRQLNKVKREVIDFTLIAEEIGNAFKNHDFSKLKLDYNPINKTDKKMIVSLSDLHIGALVDIDANTYNYEVAQRRMNEYLNIVISEIKSNDVSEVYLINLGDSIENPYMHNLGYSCEFTLSEQILMASDIIIKFMIGLSKVVNVTVAGIAGNHDRLNGDKNKGLDGDHAVKGINKAIQSFIENSNIERVVYEQADDYGHSTEMNGVHIKFVHGDLDNINDKNLIAKHSSLDGVNYSIVLMGHFHHHEIIESGIDKFVVVFGSLKGVDGYGMKIRRVSAASQGIIIIDENGEIEIKRIKLK